ncbi:hypothetical protein ACFLTM_02085 [Candidatus Bipolaricaulota bacterium]
MTNPRTHTRRILEIDRIILSGIDIPPEQAAEIHGRAIDAIRKSLADSRPLLHRSAAARNVTVAAPSIGAAPTAESVAAHVAQAVGQALSNTGGGEHA